MDNGNTHKSYTGPDIKLDLQGVASFQARGKTVKIF